MARYKSTSVYSASSCSVVWVEPGWPQNATSSTCVREREHACERVCVRARVSEHNTRTFTKGSARHRSIARVMLKSARTATQEHTQTHPKVRRVLRVLSVLERRDEKVELEVLVHNRLRVLVRNVIDRVLHLADRADEPAEHLQIAVRAHPIAIDLIRERLAGMVAPAVVENRLHRCRERRHTDARRANHHLGARARRRRWRRIRSRTPGKEGGGSEMGSPAQREEGGSHPRTWL